MSSIVFELERRATTPLSEGDKTHMTKMLRENLPSNSYEVFERKDPAKACKYYVQMWAEDPKDRQSTLERYSKELPGDTFIVSWISSSLTIYKRRWEGWSYEQKEFTAAKSVEMDSAMFDFEEDQETKSVDGYEIEKLTLFYVSRPRTMIEDEWVGIEVFACMSTEHSCWR